MGNKPQPGGVVRRTVCVEFDLAREVGAGIACPLARAVQLADFWNEMMVDLKISFPGRDDSFYSLYKQLGQSVENPLE